MTERRTSGSGARAARRVSFSDATSTSDVAGVTQQQQPPLSSLGRNPSGAAGPVLMEGMLKKRGANLPVMRDRYCVATWEMDPATRATFVLLRTYKSQKSFAASPEKPASAHTLKCFGAWDGKGNFHRYEHAFLMETRESKVFFCTVPTEGEKRKWIDVMKAAAASSSASRSSSSSSISIEGDREIEASGREVQRGLPSLVKRQSSHGRKGELFDVDSDDDEAEFEDENGGDGARHAANGMHSMTDSEQSPDDGLFRSSSGADSAFSGSERGGRGDGGVIKAEPADWGIFGESFDGPTVSKYDIVDRPVLLLDDELLNEPVDKAPLASDSFLFEDAGPSRFGAVVIKKSDADSDDDLADFVDEELAARLEREKSEKQLRKRVQKLESNRDLYAEMAAARLNSMRKDARHPQTKKSPRELSFRPSLYVGSVSEYNESEAGYSQMTDAGYNDEYSASEAGLFGESQASSRNGVDEKEARSSKPRRGTATAADNEADADSDGEGQFEEGNVEAEKDAEARRESRKKKKTRQAALESRRSATSNDLTPPSEELTLEMLAPADDDHVSEISDAEEPVVQVRRKKSKHKKPEVFEETSNVETAPIEELLVFESPDSVVNEAERDGERYEEERRLEKERRREERRVRKEKQRREEEEIAAAAAAELARQHRDAMREREEEKARKREKKERRERRERAKLEKEKKQRRSKEAELQAEVERLRLAQIQQKAEDEKKEKKKKRRDKEKYSTPAERIQRKEREAEAHAEAHAAEMSSALVLVETPGPAPAPAAAAPVLVAAAPIAQASIPAQDPQATPTPAPATVASVATTTEPAQPTSLLAPPAIAPSLLSREPIQSVFDQQQQQQEQYAAPASVPAAPQSQPAFPMMPQYLPGYPAPPQSLPMYASSPYGMYQPQYAPQPYYPPQYANMAYGPGAPMQPQYYQQPPVGFMPGAPMMGQPYPAAAAAAAGYPEMPQAGASYSSPTDDEPVFIGPKLPSPTAQEASTVRSASIGPPPPPPPPSSNAPRSASPALPDLPDLPDIADF